VAGGYPRPYREPERDAVSRRKGRGAGRADLLPKPHGFEWDLYLTGVNEYKRETLESDQEPLGGRLAVLGQGMPRFVWRATAFSGQDRVLDLLFDATDIEQGNVFLRAVEYHAALSGFLRDRLQSGLLPPVAGKVAPILRWFCR